jgi:hypothetical protein
MAQKEHLPPEVQDIILQHHGVTPVMFFYHKALQLAGGQHVDINDFRYTGPKPQTKEASIVMLADTIEAAVRSMKDPTPKGIDQFIERLIRGKLEDGQLSDCELSLRDIDKISEAFSGILKGVYHERIEYPKVPQYVNGNPAAVSAASDVNAEKTDTAENDRSIAANSAESVDAEGKETEESKTPVSASEDVPAGRDEQIADELPEQKNED